MGMSSRLPDGKVHFVGSIQTGADETVEWTSESISIFKGADRGDVKRSLCPTGRSLGFDRFGASGRGRLWDAARREIS
jgi:hypothetical protein